MYMLVYIGICLLRTVPVPSPSSMLDAVTTTRDPRLTTAIPRSVTSVCFHICCFVYLFVD